MKYEYKTVETPTGRFFCTVKIAESCLDRNYNRKTLHATSFYNTEEESRKEAREYVERLREYGWSGIGNPPC